MKFSLTLLCLLGSLAVCHADAVRLQINGPDGKPVAGAKVRIVESSGKWPDVVFLPPALVSSDKTGAVNYESKKPLAKAAEKGQVAVSGARLFATVQAKGLAVSSLPLKAGDNVLVLQLGQTFEGVALDSKQKPIANAHLLASDIVTADKKVVEVSSHLLEATTDANGHYSIEGLPRAGRFALIVADPLWKAERFELNLALKAPPLFLERGVTVKGRLLKPDGTPAGGIKIYTSSRINDQITTRADGTFEATGLEPGYAYLQVPNYGQKITYVIPPKSLSDLKAGEVRDIGDWKTTNGVRARGRVLAADTKKPIKDASVSLWGPKDASGNTDAQGNFDFPMEPGSSMVTVRADEFVALLKSGVPDAHNGSVELGTLELKRGKVVSGLLVDGEGNPIINTPLRAQKKDGNTGSNESLSGADGRFTFKGLDEGEHTLTVPGFKITKGAKFMVGAAALPALRVEGSVDSPIKKGGTGAEVGTEQTVSGRVETADGTGIAGAKISIRVQISDNSYYPRSVVSQLDGSFSATLNTQYSGRGKQVKILSVTRPGFTAGTNQSTTVDGGWNLKIKMQPLGTALQGRIVNANGQGVAGAFVALSQGSAPPVATDAAGNFALEDAPLEGVTLLASNGPSFASYEVKTAGQKVEIALPAAPPATAKAAVAGKLLENGQFGWEWGRDWDAVGAKRIEETLKRNAVNEKQAQSELLWSRFINELAHREPKTFLERESELRASTSQRFLPTFERQLMLARAAAGNDEQKNQVRAWLDEQEKVKRDISPASVTQLLSLAAIAGKLDAQSGQAWLDYAAQIGDQLPDNGFNDAWQAGWGGTVARIQKSAALTFGDGWKPSVQLIMLISTMEVYREANDLESATAAYKLGQSLAKQAADHPESDVKPQEYTPRASDVVKQLEDAYTRILSYTKPSEALALVPGSAVSPYNQVEIHNLIARNAVRLKQFDVAKKAILAMFESRIGNVEFFAQAASIAQEFDPAFAETLWSRAYEKARPRSEDEDSPGFASFAAYASGRAQNWPGESRVIIEREWQQRQAKAAKKQDDEKVNSFDGSDNKLAELTEAMAKVDMARALEMLASIPESNSLRIRTQTRLGVALLAK